MLSLSSELPLRSSTVLSEFRAVAPLPWVYGRVVLKPVPLDSDGRKWLLADHPIDGVDWVEVDGSRTMGWALINGLDDTGTPVAILHLTTPSKIEPKVQVRGARHYTAGYLLKHPADIAVDVLRRCGRPLTDDSFQALKDEDPHLEVSLAVYDRVTVRGLLELLFEPQGGGWKIYLDTATAHTEASSQIVGDLTQYTADAVEAAADVREMTQTVEVRYATDHFSGGERAGLVVTLQPPSDHLPTAPLVVSAGCIRRARDALNLGYRVLSQVSSPAWTVTFACADAALYAEPGDSLLVNHPHLPPGTVYITGVERRLGESYSVYTGKLRQPEGHTMVLKSRSSAIDAAATEPVQVIYRDGQATFTVTDEAGNPLSGAAVTLDGNTTRNTDRNGRVTFTAARGLHTLAIYRSGYAPLEQEIQL